MLCEGFFFNSAGCDWLSISEFLFSKKKIPVWSLVVFSMIGNIYLYIQCFFIIFEARKGSTIYYADPRIRGKYCIYIWQKLTAILRRRRARVRKRHSIQLHKGLLFFWRMNISEKKYIYKLEKARESQTYALHIFMKTARWDKKCKGGGRGVKRNEVHFLGE